MAGVVDNEFWWPGQEDGHVINPELLPGFLAVLDGVGQIGVLRVVKEGGWVAEGDDLDVVGRFFLLAVVFQEMAVNPLEAVHKLELAEGGAQVEEAFEDGAALGGFAEGLA